jgi:hypothetical protein
MSPRQKGGELLKLEVFGTCGVDLAKDAARNHRALRRRGHTLNANDL